MNKKQVKFENCVTFGDEINALVDCFTDHIVGDFVLSQALERVKSNKQKIKEFKESLLRTTEEIDKLKEVQ